MAPRRRTQKQILSLSQYTHLGFGHDRRGVWTNSQYCLGFRPANGSTLPRLLHHDGALRAFTLLRCRNCISGSKVPCCRKKHWDLRGYTANQTQAAQQADRDMVWWKQNTQTARSCHLGPCQESWSPQTIFWVENKRLFSFHAARVRLHTAISSFLYTDTLNLNQLACS